MYQEVRNHEELVEIHQEAGRRPEHMPSSARSGEDSNVAGDQMDLAGLVCPDAGQTEGLLALDRAGFS